MADLTITIPTDQMARAVDALCNIGGYAGAPGDQPARRQFAREQVAAFVRRTVMESERTKAMATAMASVTVDPITIN